MWSLALLSFPAQLRGDVLDHYLDIETILTSAPLIIELHNVLSREKFEKYVSLEERLRLLAGLLQLSQLVEITCSVAICRDPKDNMLLELAESGRGLSPLRRQ